MAQLGLHPLQLQLDIRSRPERRSSSAGCRPWPCRTGRRARRRPAARRSRRPGPAAGGLVLGPLDRQADVAHLLGDAGEGLADPGLRLGRGVGGLDGLLLGAEGVDLGLQPLRGQRQLLLLALQVGCCVSRSVTCCWRAARRDSASRARSSRPSASALRPWSSSLADCWPAAGSAGAPGACGRSPRRRRRGAPSAAAPAASGTSSRGSRAGPRPGPGPCWPSRGRSGPSASSGSCPRAY